MLRKSLGSGVCLLAFSLTLGAAWTTTRITYNAGDSEWPAVAASGTKVYLVWSDESPGNSEIFFGRSTNGGTTWLAPKRLTFTTGDSYAPKRIAVSGLNVYVAWWDFTAGNPDIYFIRSTDSGATWQAAKRLTNNAGYSYFPSVAAGGSNVYVVWHDDTSGNEEIYFRKSTDYGATWQTAKRLTFNAGYSERADIAVSGSNVYVVWDDNTPGRYGIYFRKSADAGATWQTAKKLTNTWADSLYPDIVVSGSIIYVAWNDNSPGNDEIYFRKSLDGGATWPAAQRLTYTTLISQYAAIGISGSNIYVAWEDSPVMGSAGDEVYVRKSINGGATWQAAQRLTNNTGYSLVPRAAVSTSKICVVWWDNSPGNFEIYAVCSPL